MNDATATLSQDSPEQSTHQSLADALAQLKEKVGEETLSVRQIVEILSDRGIVVVLIILTMPFLFPIPTMGLSAPAGMAISLYGLNVALGRKPWLPGFLLKRELSAKTIHRMVDFGSRWAKRVERFLKPRLRVMNWAGINVITGICLILNGIFMSLPLPIPATNAIPALAIILLLLGQLERDGVFVLIGHTMTLIVFGVFVGVGVYLYRMGADGAKKWLGF